jgi:CdiI N-terminal domain
MPFSIRFLDEPPFEEEGMAPHAHGLLTIGNFWEDIYSSLFLWSREQYESQWRSAVQDILDGTAKVALIVSYLTPDVSSNLEWWPIYRVGETVYFQNQLLMFDQLETPFTPENPYASLQNRKSISGTGDPISEWSVNLSDLEEFLSSRA